MKITTIGIDLAKNVFQVHGVDEHGRAVFNKPLKREQMAAFFVNLPACLIGMEACGSAHHWARKLQGIGHISERVPELIEDACNELPGAFRRLVPRLLEHLKELDRQVQELEAQIVAWHRQSDLSRKLEQIPGIGPITACALVASLGDAKSFKDGRQVAAWLGLVPRQHSSGGKQNLLGISKRGDTYLRTLLIHGARSVIYHAQNKAADNPQCCWINGVVQRRNKNVAAAARGN